MYIIIGKLKQIDSFSRTMDSFDISSDSEEGLLDEILVDGSYQQQRLQQLQRMQNYHQRQHHSYPQHYYGQFTAFSQQHQHHHHQHQHQHQQYTQRHHFSQNKQLEYDAIESSPLHYCENTTTQSDDNIYSTQENQKSTQQSQQQQLQQKQIESPALSITPNEPTTPPPPPPPLPLPLPTIRCSSSNNLNAPTLGSSAGRSTGSSTSIASTTGGGGAAASTSASAGPIATAASAPATFILQEDNNDTGEKTIQSGQLELEGDESTSNNDSPASSDSSAHQIDSNSQSCVNDEAKASTSAAAAAAAANGAQIGGSFNHQLTADMCNYKNSKSRRLEYSLKCLKYGRSNPSQDSAFGSLTDNDLSVGSSSFRISSFQSISSPIDEGVEDVIIATTTGGKETCLELATIPKSMVSQDSAISSPCRETSPSNFLNIDDGMSGSYSGASTSSGSTGNIRPQQFPVSLSPKILVTATTNSSNSSLSSSSATIPQAQQFDPPKILVNDQNSIYTTSPSKRIGTIEVFSQKYRVSSFEDMSPNKRSSSDKLLKNVNRMAFRSLEEERRIDSAFMPIGDRTSSENRVNMQRDEKYKKLTHASFRISKTSSQVIVYENTPSQITSTSPVGNTNVIASVELQRPATASGSISSRQTMWRDSKFYRKNRIAKSNDSLLETSPNHSARLSPSSLRDNHYDSSSSYGSRSQSRQSLNRGSSINEISGLNQTFGGSSGGGSVGGGGGIHGLAVTTSFCGNVGSAGAGRRYCSSKSEDLADSNDYLRVMDARKSYSERHLVTLTKLKQTAINNTMSGSEQCCFSEDEMSFYDDNNVYGYMYYNEQQQKQQHHHHNQHHVKQQHRQQQQQQQQQQQIQQRRTHYNPHQATKSTKQQQMQTHQKQQQQQQQKHHQPQQQTKRSHPNHLSWSSCSINRIRTTNIKTTSLATLSCHQNLAYSASAHSPNAANTPAACTIEALPRVSRSAIFKSVDHFVNLTDKSSCGDGGTGSGGSGTCTATDDNSSTDDSPTHQTLSAAELSKIFAMHDAQSSHCSEEKTPLLDSVEMSPISPTETEDLGGGEKM